MRLSWATNVAVMDDFNSVLNNIRSYYNTGATLSYSFRKQQLISLQNAILKYEVEINEALYADLKKVKKRCMQQKVVYYWVK